ncbi:phosphoribosylaminoimidazole-succinocarboxamide synthase [Natranaerovirga pectinivora]|uniref:Phosphoribosylaminoimidazole-succinocarboxamide synthase n=1 Tax=Natranaerovirga pectinivora TaxID=682400 RepID=A0A4R3MPK0_9FIRM|nr:phosphoribosylaminoimidazolesuccinocarboxamide synthase [Natranaerovirga pectinivora]TCT16201.1 phosphoribosylaminoimidazole-succinocarboxamide synthase [Natranaerovirga pectinivora]
MKNISSGKVRDIYEVDEKRLLMVVSDRISAFDHIMPNDIPQKGILLNQMSAFWFDYVSDLIPNHVLSTKLDDFPKEFQNESFQGRSMLVKKLKMLPIECIVRGYLSGSSWKSYLQTSEICGIKIQKGMKESEKLPTPIFTPSSKAHSGSHDENITFEKAIELLGEDLSEKIKSKSIEIYDKCARYALSKGLIIADAKFEFGLDNNGELIIADEILTPDSSRFWLLDTYEIGRSQDSLDKQYLRNWLSMNGYANKLPNYLPQHVIEMTKSKYLECYEKIMGQSFEVII